jgi:hypothetical protein
LRSCDPPQPSPVTYRYDDTRNYGRLGHVEPSRRDNPNRHSHGLPEPSRRGLTPRSNSAGRLHVIAYRATLDVPGELAQFTARLLLAARHPAGQPGAELFLAGGAGVAVVPRPGNP